MFADLHFPMIQDGKLTSVKAGHLKSFAAVSESIQDKEGVSKDVADKIAGKIGEEKYGKEGMAERSKEGREKSMDDDLAEDSESVAKSIDSRRVNESVDFVRKVHDRSADLDHETITSNLQSHFKSMSAQEVTAVYNRAFGDAENCFQSPAYGVEMIRQSILRYKNA